MGIRAHLAAAALSVTGTLAQQRPVYQYSMIPGGVHSAEEWAKVTHEPVYQGYGLEGSSARLAQVRLRKDETDKKIPLARFVSFQKDGQVRWTDHPVALHLGEYVLTIKGQIAVRGRCGNLLTKAPPPTYLRTAIVPSDTPEIELPPIGIPPIMTWTPPDWRTPFELQPSSTIPPAPPVAPPTPPATPLAPSATGVPTFVPGGFHVPSGGSGTASTQTTGVTTAPEPETWGLAALALATFAWIRRGKRRKSATPGHRPAPEPRDYSGHRELHDPI